MHILELPLYRPMKHEKQEDLYSAILGDSFVEETKQLDAHCPACDKVSTFTLDKPYHISDVNRGSFPIKIIILKCARNPHHALYLIFHKDGDTYTKIGQFPSLADLMSPKIKEYGKILKRQQIEDYRLAVGLASHGVGVAPIIYLRRIYEYLLDAAYDRIPDKTQLFSDKWKKSRVVEKIEMAKSELPELLITSKSLYGILSKSVHELSEDECRDFFPTLLSGVELILDESVEKRKVAQKKAEFTQNLTELSGKLKDRKRGTSS